MRPYVSCGLLLHALLLAGCVSSAQPPSRPLYSPKPVTMLQANAQPEISLTKEYVFVRNGGGTIMGGARLTILTGAYVKAATDEAGTYWMHKDRGILRSGNMGISDRGGIYIPTDTTRLLEVWMTPQSSDAAIGLLGPVAAAAIPITDPRSNVIFVGDVPPEISFELRTTFAKQ